VTKARQFRGFRKSLTVMNSRNMKKKKLEKQEGLIHRGFVSKARQFRDFAKILYLDEHKKTKNPKQFSLPLLLLLKFPIPCSSCVCRDFSFDRLQLFKQAQSKHDAFGKMSFFTNVGAFCDNEFCLICMGRP
jgi:hypothetical protein